MTWRSLATKNPHPPQAGIDKASSNGGRRRSLRAPTAGISQACSSGDLELSTVTEDRYRQLFENTRDGILLLNADTAQIDDVNPSLMAMLGYSHAEFLDKELSELNFFVNRAECSELLTNIKEKGYVRYDDISLVAKSGAQVDVECVCSAYDSEGVKVICNIRDNSERRESQKKARRDSQLYAALSQCNKAIVQSSSENELFLKVCQAAVEYGNMKMVWIGLLDHKTGIVNPVARFGEHTEYLDSLNISVDPAAPTAHGPTGIAINEKHPYWSQDFLNDSVTTSWHDHARKVGWKASAAIPLFREGVITGALGLYSGEINAFDEAARSLLIEMAMDVSYALDNLERESQRQKANDEIEFKNTVLRTQQETSLDAILVADDEGKVISYNQQFIDLWKLSPRLIAEEMNAPAFKAVLDQLENPEIFVARVKHLYECHDKKSREEMRLRDGRVIDRYSAPMTNDSGKYYGRVWYFRDITEQKKTEQELARNALRQQTLMSTSFDGIHVMDEQGNVVEANDAFCKMLGYTQEEIMHLNITDWDAQWSFDELQEVFKSYLGKNGLLETVHRRNDGSLINVEISVSGVILDGSNYFFGTSRDITERKRTEKELLIAAAAFEAQEGIIVTGPDNVILRTNKSFTRITGYTAEEAIGQTPQLLHSGIHDANFYKQMWQDLKRNKCWRGEIWNQRKNGEVYPEWLNISAVLNSEGQVANYIGSFADITERKAAEDRVERLAFYDHLTGLPNRRLLLDRLQHTQAASARENEYNAVLFIDIDNFKVLNDTRGHGVGDKFLVEVANRLEMSMRNGDTVARLGGDEFVILLEKLSESRLQAASQAEIVCEKILTAFTQPFLLNEYEYHSSASIGVCQFLGYEVSVDELLKRADTAMYQAKSEGRNTLCFYDPVMQTQLQARTSLTDDLRHALEENQFRLYYQMQVDHKGCVIGAETLIRWQHPIRGLITPMEFIPLAEEIGLITAIGQWVLDMACSRLKQWEGDPKMQNLCLAVNVSARQFHQDDFVEKISKTLNAHAINPGMLKIELTETLVLDNIAETIVKMNALKKLGVIFSMDDFGTGYSSLSYLTQLPLDQLKIDQSFVRNMEVQHRDAAIVQTIIGMAHNLGIEVIAEGVESRNQRNFLEKLGCVFYQGYLFGKPVPVEEFESVLQSS